MTGDLLTGFAAGCLYCICIVIFIRLLDHLTAKKQDEIAKAAALHTPELDAQPIDPDRPPVYETYVRLDVDPETRCTCHNLPLIDGGQILRWPRPDALYCASGALPHRQEEQ